jgi:GNAT superfamily N-acetyltransferase
LDAGYLSRLLSHLEQSGVLDRVPSDEDARLRLLKLTHAGQETAALLNQRSREEIAAMLADLSEDEQQRLLKAMQTIERSLDRSLMYASPFVLRMHEPGDMGWVVHRHGVLYAREYGWNAQFEAMVAQIVADFINNFKPERERCWIAEMDGEIVGSIFCVQVSETVAKLRLLLVEPKARGLGLGARLVDECIRFARRKGYAKLVLWTNDILVEAIHLYQKAGFQRVSEGPYHAFGHDLVEQTWELDLLR